MWRRGDDDGQMIEHECVVSERKKVGMDNMDLGFGYGYGIWKMRRVNFDTMLYGVYGVPCITVNS